MLNFNSVVSLAGRISTSRPGNSTRMGPTSSNENDKNYKLRDSDPGLLVEGQQAPTQEVQRRLDPV